MEEYIWTRLRGIQRVARVGAGDLRLGGEAVLQGGGDAADQIDLDTGEFIRGERYRSFQLGPVVQFQPTPALQLIGSAGAKTDNLSFAERPDWFPYFKVEFVLVP